MLVRLKPYDPRRGYVLRRYTYRGIKFQEERGWYRVDEDVADYLRDVHQRHGDLRSPLAFDVHTEEEALAMEAEEEANAAARKAASHAVDVTSRPSAAKPKAATPRKAPAKKAAPKTSPRKKPAAKPVTAASGGASAEQATGDVPDSPSEA